MLSEEVRGRGGGWREAGAWLGGRGGGGRGGELSGRRDGRRGGAGRGDGGGGHWRGPHGGLLTGRGLTEEGGEGGGGRCSRHVGSRVEEEVRAEPGVGSGSERTDLGLELGQTRQLGQAVVEEPGVSGQERVEAGVEGVRRVRSGYRGRRGAPGRGRLRSGRCWGQGKARTSRPPALGHFAGGGRLSGHLRSRPSSHDAVNTEVADLGSRPRRHGEAGRHGPAVRRVRSSVGRAPVTGAAQAVSAQPVLVGESPVLGAWGAVLEVSHVPHQPLAG